MDKQNNAQMRYLAEASLQLRRAGFQTEEPEDGYMNVTWEGTLLCRVMGNGDVRYQAGDIESGQHSDAFHKLMDVTDRVSEYMRLMESSPRLEATGLHEDYRLMSEFNGIVLAGHKFTDVPGHQFATWERDYDRTGVIYGHYHGDFAEAKRDFATRSGLIQKGRQFSDGQLAEVYRCIFETLDSDYPITPQRESVLKACAEQIERAVPDLDRRVEQSYQEELEYAGQLPGGPVME